MGELYAEPRSHRCDPPAPSMTLGDALWRCECGKWWEHRFSPWKSPDYFWRWVPRWYAWFVRQNRPAIERVGDSDG